MVVLDVSAPDIYLRPFHGSALGVIVDATRATGGSGGGLPGVEADNVAEAMEFVAFIGCPGHAKLHYQARKEEDGCIRGDFTSYSSRSAQGGRFRHVHIRFDRGSTK